jgi:hypothetical protein
VWRSIHHYPSASIRPSIFSYHYSLTVIFGRIRPIKNCSLYMVIRRLFFEDQLPTQSLHPPLPTQHDNVELLPAEQAALQLSSLGDLK